MKKLAFLAVVALLLLAATTVVASGAGDWRGKIKGKVFSSEYPPMPFGQRFTLAPVPVEGSESEFFAILDGPGPNRGQVIGSASVITEAAGERLLLSFKKDNLLFEGECAVFSVPGSGGDKFLRKQGPCLLSIYVDGEKKGVFGGEVVIFHFTP